jgi:hypothetical protein
MSNKFKKLRQKIGAFFSPSPADDLSSTAERQRRNEAFIKFAQAGFTVLMGVWLAPVFYGQANVAIAMAVVFAVMFVIQGFKIWLSDSPPASTPPVKRVSPPARLQARTLKSPTPVRRNLKTQQSPSPSATKTREESTLALTLSELEQQGWQITYNLLLPNQENVDVLLKSPHNHHFMVEIQTCRGEVFFDDGILKRREWSSLSNFNEDLLNHVTQKALAVKTLEGLKSVIPILCFTQATLSIETVNNKARDVYVVKQDYLVRKLFRLDQS